MELKEKLLNIQMQLKVPKAQTNKFGGYNFRSCEDILEMVKPLCTAYKTVVMLSDSIELIGDRYYIKAMAKISDVEKIDEIGTFGYAREPKEKKGFDESQITGAASSYARKYALSGLFGIDDSDLVDSLDVKDRPIIVDTQTNPTIQLATTLSMVESNPKATIINITEPIIYGDKHINAESYITDEQIAEIGKIMKDKGWTVKMATKLIGEYNYTSRSVIKQKDFEDIKAKLSATINMKNYI